MQGEENFSDLRHARGLTASLFVLSTSTMVEGKCRENGGICVCEVYSFDICFDYDIVVF